MATPTTLRLPWRLAVRSISTNPSTQLLRPQCSANHPVQTIARRWATDSTEDKHLRPHARSELTVGGGMHLGAPNPRSPFDGDGSDGDVSDQAIKDLRLPRAVQAVYLRPLRREAKYGFPSCNLQLRSYNVRNLEFMCDFALRAAYYCHLPAYGPVPLPRIVERWTVPRGHFIHKKKQENFERKTLRRLIQIKDGNPETVEIWLAFLRKHSYYGVGMKANVWEFSGLDVGKKMDLDLEKLKDKIDPTLDLFAFNQDSKMADKVLDTLNREDFRAASGFSAPMIQTPPSYRPHEKK